jgi:3-oxoacyl-[acyl-carrier-protein] synthase II
MMDITAWSAISPYGLGAQHFAAGMRQQRPAMTWADPRACGGLVPASHLVPGFDQREVLGKKGTKGMDRMTGLAVAAVGHLTQARPEPDAALVLGTTAGSVQSSMAFTQASLTGERPFDVDPATIPSTVMNTPAGHCAIWHGITGPNTTIASGRASGLLGLAYARRLLRAGRARTVLCGAVEEYSPARSWLASACAGEAGPAALGEGAAVLRLEPAGAADALATVLAVDSAMAVDRVPGTAQVVAERALRQAGIAPGQVWGVVSGTRPERDSLAGMFGHDVLDRMPPVAELIGDTGAVSAVFQLAAALVLAPGRYVLILSADPAGMTAVAVLLVAA